MVAPSQIPPGEYPNAPMPKELEEHEIQGLLVAYADAARRAIAAGLDGVESTCRTATCRGSSSRRSTTTAPTGGAASYEKRLRFPVESMNRVRAAIGDEAFLGYRINSTSFWPGDLEMDDVKRSSSTSSRRSTSTTSTSPRVFTTPTSTRRWPTSGLGARLHAGVKEVSRSPSCSWAASPTPTSPRTSSRRRGRRDPARAPDVRRRGLGGEGARRPRGRHPPLRGRQLLLAQRDPWRPRAVRLQRRGRTRARLGRETPPARPQPTAVLVLGGGPRRARVRAVAAARGLSVLLHERGVRPAATSAPTARCRTATKDGDIGIWLTAHAARRGDEAPRPGRRFAPRRVLAAERPDHVVVATGSRVAETASRAGRRADPRPRDRQLRRLGRGGPRPRGPRRPATSWSSTSCRTSRRR